MKVFMGGIAMETNSFSPILADCDTFRRGYWLEGNEVETLRSSAMDVGGFYQCLDAEPDVEICPGFTAYAVTSGPVKDEDFSIMTKKLFQSLQQAGKVDGVLLALHGALQSECMDDCEGYIAERVRQIVGDPVPVVAVCDLHACITKKMVENLDGITGYMTYPHTDHHLAGYRAAESLLRLMRTKVKPVKFLSYVPMIMPVENCNTSEGPIVSVMAKYRALLENPFVTAAGLFLTQPWLDTAELGCQMCVFFEDEAHRAACKKAADEILKDIWDKRNDFLVVIQDMDTVLKQAKAQLKPFCVVELGDIVSAGGCGDSTVALRALLGADLDLTSCLMVVDPETVHEAQRIGVGNRGYFKVGKTDAAGYNQRVPIEAEVVHFNAKPYRNLGDTQKGVLTDGGRRVLLRVGKIHLIVSEYAYCCHDRNALISMGVDPCVMDVIIQKTHQMFKKGYEGVMGSFLYADTPGYTDRNLVRLPYKRCPRPIFPLDVM